MINGNVFHEIYLLQGIFNLTPAGAGQQGKQIRASRTPFIATILTEKRTWGALL